MASYMIKVVEKNVTTFVIQAESEEEAKEIAKAMQLDVINNTLTAEAITK